MLRYLLVSLLAVTPLAMAQTAQRPAPEEMLRMADSSTAATLATLERTVDAQLNAELKLAERPETAERIATFKKNLFDALRKKGFTADESLKIVLATPVPGQPR
jgi:hypothetical protein